MVIEFSEAALLPIRVKSWFGENDGAEADKKVNRAKSRQIIVANFIYPPYVYLAESN
jgi:hypothetical protein